MLLFANEKTNKNHKIATEIAKKVLFSCLPKMVKKQKKMTCQTTYCGCCAILAKKQVKKGVKK